MTGASFLAVLSERDAIRWVVRERQIAFPPTPRREVGALRQGDRLFLLSTRGAFHNPVRDRTRLIGIAKTETSVHRFDDPIDVAGRSFTSGCGIRLSALAPFRMGAEFAPLVSELEKFAGQSQWGMLLRRPLVSISEHDAERLQREVSAWRHELPVAISSY